MLDLNTYNGKPFISTDDANSRIFVTLSCGGGRKPEGAISLEDSDTRPEQIFVYDVDVLNPKLINSSERDLFNFGVSPVAVLNKIDDENYHWQDSVELDNTLAGRALSELVNRLSRR